jgi:hypothetical protein
MSRTVVEELSNSSALSVPAAMAGATVFEKS